MALPIEIDELKRLVHNNKIDRNFAFINDPQVMYLAIKENPNLSNLLDYDTGKRVVFQFKIDKNLSHDLKKTLFKHLIRYYEIIPDEHIKLIENGEDYLEIASSELVTYVKLIDINHKFKKQEEELFYKLYEDRYIFNPSLPIPYAKKSPTVLLKTLKAGIMNIYYISFFEKEAINDEVIEYLDKKNLINNIDIPVMMTSPKIVLLKLKRNNSLIFNLSSSMITDEIINYLESIHFDARMIEDYIDKNRQYPICLRSSKIMLMLLKQSMDNIKYLQGNEIDQEIIDFLNHNHYLYQHGHNLYLLQDNSIFNRFINKKENLLFILKENIVLNSEQINIIQELIIKNNIDFSSIQNLSLITDKNFAKALRAHAKIPNPYNLLSSELITNLGRSLPKLQKIFSDNDLQIIIRELVKNHYYIDMLHILESIDANKFRVIYDKLSLKENKFNQNFNFYFFIKVGEYFTNNLSLLKELNKKDIADELMTNLSLAINNKDYINYNELVNYKKIYKEKIDRSNMRVEDKLFKLLVNGNYENVEKFLSEIIDVKKLLYLQLEFDQKSNEYQLLEIYLSVINLLEKVYKYETNPEQLYNEIKEKFVANSLFDLKVMQENILKMYAKIYQKLGISKEILRRKGKSEKINNSEIFHIAGEEFVFYVHSENFNSQDDSTILDTPYSSIDYKNYICTSFASDLFPYGLDNSGMHVYDLHNINSLIAFGNKDIFIDHLPRKPLFKAENQFVNPIDMAFIHGRGYTPTEFDFLRCDDQNQILKSSYIIVKNHEEARTLANNKDSSYSILVFDKEKHQQYLERKVQFYCQNVNSLTYKDLYKLIAMSTRFPISDDVKECVIDRISKLSAKEQIVLDDALAKYHFSVKADRKKH